MKSLGVGLLAMFVTTAAFAEDATTTPDTSPPPPAAPAQVKPGDVWDYEVRDGLTDKPRSTINVTVTDVSASEIDARVHRTQATSNHENTWIVVYDRNWRTKENGEWRYSPPNDSFGVPDQIAVKKTWTYSRESKRATPATTSKARGTANVIAWERVTLPSGASYDAYRIEFVETVFPVVNNVKIESRIVEWYAPSVNRYVKRSWDTHQNGKFFDGEVEYLTSYEPQS